MRVQPRALIALLLTFGLLGACGEKAENEAVSTTPAPIAEESESAANDAGTTTYYGEEEQTQPANN